MLERTQPLRVEVTWDRGAVAVILTGELDTATAPGMAERLMKVAEGNPERLVLDLGDMVFVDVAGARALDSAYKALEAECPVTLRWPRPSARGAFRLAAFLGV